MKKKLLKKEWLFGMLSALILGVFVVMAISSGEYSTTEHLGGGVYKTTYDNFSDDVKIYKTGKRNEYGQWNGLIKSEYEKKGIIENDGEETFGVVFSSVEEVNYVDGHKHGKSVYSNSDGKVRHSCYNMGRRVDCEKSAKGVSVANTAFQVLQSEYPWYQNLLNDFGFDDAMLETFFETFEAELAENNFDIDEFDDYYLYPEKQMEESSDSMIMQVNAWQTTLLGFDLLKDNEFRKTVIDRFRTGNIKTSEIIEKTYPGYQQTIINEGATVSEFNLFCDVFDTNLDSLPTLKQDNPLCVDTLELNMFTVLYKIYNTSYSESKAGMAMKSADLLIKNMSYSQLLNAMNQMVGQSKKNTNPNDIASLVLGSMFAEDDADIIKLCMKKAYILKSGLVEPPLVVSSFDERNSETSVNIAGYIVQNGGATVTGSGIVWGTAFNPTSSDNTIDSGTEIGAFTATISGLTQNKTYYARAFATNSEGTSYGNCIKFTTALTSSLNSIKQNNFDFDVYPNPAVNFSFVEINVESPQEMELYISNAIGQVVYQKKLGYLVQGTNKCELDVSRFKSGIYHCTLTNGSVKTTKKLLVSH